MIQDNNRIHLIRNSIEPIIDHPVSQLAIKIVVETVKILAAKMFLEFLGRNFLKVPSKFQRRVFHLTIFAPIAEEILFRGILLGGIFLMQKLRNHLKGNDLSEEDKKVQQRFRIFLSAFIFSAAHYSNDHETVWGCSIQLLSTFFGGIGSGYLTEKYHTLSVSILAHGFNNCLAVAKVLLYPSKASFFWVAIIVNQVGACILGVMV